VKLTRGLTIIIGVVVLVALLGAGFFLVVKPARDSVSDLDQQIEDARSQIQTEQNRALRLKELQQDPEQFVRQLDDLQQRLPENVQLADVVEQIDHAAEEAGLDFSSFKASNPSSEGSYYKADLEIEMLGRYFNMVEFFNHVERLPRTVKVVKVSMVEDDDTLPYLQITITAKVFFSSAEGVDLRLTEQAPAPTTPTEGQ
jgi:Tfp pilus assembly protein PilO